MIPTGTLPEVVLTLLVGFALAPLIGRYIANVFSGRSSMWDPVVGRIERGLYALMGVDPHRSMDWKQYVRALLLTDGSAIVFVFVLLQLQGGLPWNSFGAPDMSWHLALHTASAFGTNTDFQHYVPESQLSEFSALFGLQTLMFLSPATGLSVFAAISRGFARRDGRVGNYYVDLIRSLTRILVPFTVIGAFLFVLLGVPETLSQSAHLVPLVSGGSSSIPLGPVASWDSIEFLGTNGGGFFAANAAHPFQNPTGATNFVAILLMMAIPFSLPFAFARIVRRPGEVWPLVATVLTIFLVS
ncbi:MAG TPA: potassium-transporting ATPase subunit KdpA, partial [Thermoplasmata archaeon]|nr:potassium-transporting ATPase subunit KdpA [Thermoplasmata archaeon]